MDELRFGRGTLPLPPSWRRLADVRLLGSPAGSGRGPRGGGEPAPLPDAGATLARIDSIADVETVSNGGERFEYRLKADEELLPRIASELVAANVPILALAPEHRDLEHVFAEVNGEVARA